MTDPLIRCQNVSFAYTPERQLLTNITFNLWSGERVGIMGPTGCGKTTLLHLLVGLLKPDAGGIRAFGKMRRAETDFREVRVRAGLVFQDSDDQLFSPTVLEDVAFGPLNLGKTSQEAVEISRHTLETLGLQGFEDRITYKLSYGEKRLVAIATVLSMSPDVLLLDEPTNGLDEQAKYHLSRVLLRLPQAMLIISHETAFLETVATRIMRLAPDGSLK